MAVARHCFVLISVEAGTRAYTDLSSAGTRDLFQEVKHLRHEADYTPSSAEVKNVWSCTSTLPYACISFRGTTSLLHLYTHRKNCSDS